LGGIVDDVSVLPLRHSVRVLKVLVLARSPSMQLAPC